LKNVSIELPSHITPFFPCGWCHLVIVLLETCRKRSLIWAFSSLQSLSGGAVWVPPASSRHHDAFSQEALPPAVLLTGLFHPSVYGLSPASLKRVTDYWWALLSVWWDGVECFMTKITQQWTIIILGDMKCNILQCLVEVYSICALWYVKLKQS